MVKSGWLRFVFHGSPLRPHSGQQEVGRSAAAIQDVLGRARNGSHTLCSFEAEGE